MGYCDMGVLQVGGEDKLGSNGISSFDGDGRVLVGYNDLALARSVDDVLACYAMNVISCDEVWLYYWTWKGSFSISRLVNGRIDQVWPNLPAEYAFSGSGAFAVDGDRLLFAGGFAGA